VRAVAVGLPGAGGGRVWAAPALEPAKEPAQCAGRRAAVAAAPGANPARSGGLAGQRGKNQGVRTPTDPYVTAERASVRQKTEPTTRESSSRTPATGGGFGLYAQRRNTRLFREITAYQGSLSKVRRMSGKPFTPLAFFPELFLVLLVGQLGVEPEAGVSPVAFDGCQREAQRLGDFRHGQAGEEAELDHLGLDWIVRGQAGERLIERRQVLGRCLHK